MQSNMHTMWVYLITNVKNGKRYVGITTVGVEKRWVRHIACAPHTRRPLAHAIMHHGAHSFNVTTLEECCDKAELCKREQHWIAELGTRVPHGYNLTDGGEGMSGHTPSLETRRRMSTSHSGRRRSQSTRTKMSAAAKSRSSETRAKISRARSGRRLSDETRKKIAAKLLGRRLTSTHTAKIRGAMRSDVVRARLSAAAKNRSAETLRKLGRASSRPVAQLDVAGDVLRVFSSIGAAASSIGVTGSAISHVVHERRRDCRGTYWRFASREELAASETTGA